uniref:Nitrilase n=1 Tax=uncultured organism TaxID=155900 RepID=Q6RWH6_9ZZZZ|nr:nitrilase [uncultured organism]
MTTYGQFRLAAINAAPVYFDREASTEKACRLILEAGASGATLAAFGETWLPGYPFHIWREVPTALRVEYIANAVEIPSPTTDRLCAAARQANIDVVIGVVELDAQTHGTVYCTLLFIGSDGSILGRHRKIKPTFVERTAWGEGDGSSLIVYERPYGKISGLCCWEHNMVLPGYALMAQGTQIHIAAWPGWESTRHLLLSRAFASQAAAYVIDVGAIVNRDDLREDYQALIAGSYWGGSCIINPEGEVIAGPAKSETILVADCSTEQIFSSKVLCDVGGHYSRPDIFQLHVNRKPYQRIVETNNPHPAPIEFDYR